MNSSVTKLAAAVEQCQVKSRKNVSFEMPLTDRNMQVRFCLKVTEYS